eukprot:9338816-Pyramimonas_sp.AAC.1
MWLSPQRRAHWSWTFARASRMEGLSFLQNVALASSSHTFVLNLEIRRTFTNGGRVLFGAWLSPQRRAQSSSQFASISRIEGEPSFP